MLFYMYFNQAVLDREENSVDFRELTVSIILEKSYAKSMKKYWEIDDSWGGERVSTLHSLATPLGIAKLKQNYIHSSIRLNFQASCDGHMRVTVNETGYGFDSHYRKLNI